MKELSSEGREGCLLGVALSRGAGAPRQRVGGSLCKLWVQDRRQLSIRVGVSLFDKNLTEKKLAEFFVTVALISPQ